MSHVEGFAEEIAKMVGKDKEEVLKILETLPLDKMFSILDALSDEDEDEIKKLVLGKQEKEIKEESTRNPFNIADEVKYKGKDGIVKIPDGPNDSVGIIIDGELKMVDRRKVSFGKASKQLKESILTEFMIGGPSNIPIIGGNSAPRATDELQRMLQLAGRPIDSDCEVECDPEDEDCVPCADDAEVDEMDNSDNLKCALDLLDQAYECIREIEVHHAPEVLEKVNAIVSLVTGQGDR